MQSCILWKLNLENDLQKKADTKEGHWGKARPSSTPPTHVRTPSSPPLMFPSINPFVAQALWPCTISLCPFFFLLTIHIMTFLVSNPQGTLFQPKSIKNNILTMDEIETHEEISQRKNT